jgi:hypothetical protein
VKHFSLLIFMINDNMYQAIWEPSRIQLGLGIINTLQNSVQQALLFTAYISGGKRFPLDPLGEVTLITLSKDHAPWVKWRRFAKGERPLLFRHGDFDLFSTRLSRVTSSRNPDLKLSLTKPWSHCNVPFLISS